MSLIDTSYFVKDISIPNLDEIPNSIRTYIERFEKEVLIKLLGRPLYNDFISGLEATTIEQKWIDLRDGADFTFEFDGRQVVERWNGLINQDKVSLISYYVYEKYRRIEKTTTTGVAEVRGKVENSEVVNETQKIITAQNRFIDLYGEVRYSIDGINYDYFESQIFFDKRSNTYDFYNDWPSAFNFLNSRREDDYPNWEFSPIRRLNEFGL